MNNKKQCRYCGKEIDMNKDKLVLLGTYEERSALDESYFHYDCFVDWFNNKLKGKAKTIIKEQPQTAMLFGLGENLMDPSVMNNINGLANQNYGGVGNNEDLGMAENTADGLLGDIFNMAGNLLQGLDIGGVDMGAVDMGDLSIRKDAEKMTNQIKKTANKISKKIPKKDGKKKTAKKTSKK